VAQRACEVLPNTEIHNIYGPTEATIWVSSWHCNGGDFEGVATSPIGPPLANTQLYVLDDKLQPVPVGEANTQALISFFQSRNVYVNSEMAYTGNLNPETPGDSKNAFLHGGHVLDLTQAACVLSAERLLVVQLCPCF